MNAQLLLAHYRRITDAPDAIARLRRFILDLAVRGKLVPRVPNDEPVSELLEQVEHEKTRLVRAGEIKPQPTLPQPSPTECEFSLPPGWSWANLADVAVCLDYMRRPINSAEREARIEGKHPDELFPYYGANQQQGWIDDYIFDDELLLLGEDGVPFFEPFRSKSYVIKGKAWVNNHAHVFWPIFVSPQYLMHYLNVFDYNGRIVGATRTKLNQARALDIPVPLPPLAEQRRIVAKVDELMALCDRLEAARAEREATRDRLTAASLARLDTPDPDPATFATHAHFALDHLPALTARPDQIKHLRQTILNLAVRGKLVPQDENEEPAPELLERILKEKARSRRTVVAIGRDDEPFPLPRTWKWAALDQLIVLGPQNGISPKPTNREDAPKAITLTATTSGVFNSAYFKYVEAKIPDNSDFWLADGDLLFQRGNTREYVGMAAVYRGPPHTFLFPDLIMKVRVSTDVCLEYAHFASISPAAREFFSAKASGAQATMPKISQTTLVSLPVPLPPLAEQHRIVAKVNALMALCDRLEVSLAAAHVTQRRLLEAFLAKALELPREPTLKLAS